MSNATLKIVGKNAIKSLKTMGANIDIPIEQLKKIPQYEFYIHNKDTKYPAQLFSSYDFLVKESDEPSWFYSSKKEFMELLRYFVKESNFYNRFELTKEDVSIEPSEEEKPLTPF